MASSTPAEHVMGARDTRNDEDGKSRFDAKMRDHIANSYQGTSSIQMLSDYTGGQEDIRKRLRFMVRRQFWTSAQVINLIFGVACVTTGVISLVFVLAFTGDIEYFNGNDSISSPRIFFFVLGFFIGAFLTMRVTRGELICNPRAELVQKEGSAGQPCFDGDDCTASPDWMNSEHPLCMKSINFKWIRHIRKGVVLISLIVLIVSAVTNSMDRDGFTLLPTAELFVALTTGLALGVITLTVLA